MPTTARQRAFRRRSISVLLLSHSLALSSRTSSGRSIAKDLQACFAPEDILNNVGRHVSPRTDASGDLARLALVRLAKQWIVLDNNHNHQLQQQRRLESTTMQPWWEDHPSTATDSSMLILEAVILSMLESARETAINTCSMDVLVEGTKACSTIARLVPQFPCSSLRLLLSFWNDISSDVAARLKEHEVSGLCWALETLALQQRSSSTIGAAVNLPDPLQKVLTELDLPFHITPGLLSRQRQSPDELCLPNMVDEVDFQADQIRTASNQLVTERRETCWQGDAGVAPFEYGGKTMPTQPWSPTVKRMRDVLSNESLSHSQYFDCCLLNYYPNGGSGMRYHSDPDQGLLWDYDTVVVSVGATRRFAFRRRTGATQDAPPPHTFVVMHGDVTHMFGHCQEEYQHCVKKAESKSDNAARASLVFKRSWGLRT